MPKSKSKRRKVVKVNQPKAVTWPVYYEQTENDAERVGQLGQADADARKAAGTWPNPDDRSEMGMMKLGRALRQVSERAEIEFYRPVTDWLHTHPQFRYKVESIEHGMQVAISFALQIGQQAFLRAFPHWTTEQPSNWLSDVPTGLSKYDLPDEFEEGDGQHRRQALR